MKRGNFTKNRYSNGHRYDYEYKSKILKDSPFIKLESQIRKAIYYHMDVYDYDGTFLMDLDTAIALQDMLSNNSDYIEARKINASFRQRRSRLRDRIERIVYTGNAYFITLTFNDKYIMELSDKVKRKYVTQYLKEYADIYVANADYGSKNGRLHYHAVASLKEDREIEWIYGFSNFEKIVNVEDSVKLASYVSKLTNHAIKESTKRSTMIYSRNN